MPQPRSPISPQLSCRPGIRQRPSLPVGPSPRWPAGCWCQQPPASAALSCSQSSPPLPAPKAGLLLYCRTARPSRRCRAPAPALWGRAWVLGRGPAPRTLQKARRQLGWPAAVQPGLDVEEPHHRRDLRHTKEKTRSSWYRSLGPCSASSQDAMPVQLQQLKRSKRPRPTQVVVLYHFWIPLLVFLPIDEDVLDAPSWLEPHLEPAARERLLALCSRIMTAASKRMHAREPSLRTGLVSPLPQKTPPLRWCRTLLLRPFTGGCIRGPLHMCEAPWKLCQLGKQLHAVQKGHKGYSDASP
jgi:hypothetical protein